jgi:hypothetical protein
MQNDINVNQVRERLKRIGGGEIEFWKYTVLTEPEIFQEVLCLIFKDEEQIAWRAAWIIDNATEKYPELLIPHIPAVIELFLRTKNSSLLRIFTRILYRHEIPENSTGAICDRCYELLSPVYPVAVRANSMQLIYKITECWPDMKPELAMVLSVILEDAEDAGIISKARNLLKKLNRNSMIRKSPKKSHGDDSPD